MQKDIVLLVSGVAVFAVPFIGVPESWKAIVLFVLGGTIVLTALLYRFEKRRGERYEDEMLHEEHEPAVQRYPLEQHSNEEVERENDSS